MNREPRTLYYIPIIHTSADMGSLAKAVTERGIIQVGERNWERHVNTVHRFWDRIAEYCASLPAEGMKIYQDGLVAEGEIGAKIIAAGAESGSRNYEIVLSLMRRGAQIVQTEDFKLVLEERDRILELVNAKNFRGKISAFIKYRFVKHGLLKRRDMFIAQRIAETLALPKSAAGGQESPHGDAAPTRHELFVGAEPLSRLREALCFGGRRKVGERISTPDGSPVAREGLTAGGPAPHSPDRDSPRRSAPAEQGAHRDAGGILFIGACHNVKSRLPKDIKVIEIKEAKKVRKYQELLPFSRQRSRRFAELGKYLAAEIVAHEAAFGIVDGQ